MKISWLESNKGICKLKLVGRNLGRVFNSRCGRTCLCCAITFVTKTAELKVENSAQTTFRLSHQPGNTKGGKYHCTVDLLFDWFGISCMTTDNYCFYLQNRLIQTSQTGGQRYNDTPPFSIPCISIRTARGRAVSTLGWWRHHFCLCVPLTSSQFTKTWGLLHIPGNTKGGSITVPLTSCLTGSY